MSRILNSLVSLGACVLAALAIFHNRYDIATFWAVWMVETAVVKVVYAIEDSRR
jgi:hypothetical protein